MKYDNIIIRQANNPSKVLYKGTFDFDTPFHVDNGVIKESFYYGGDSVFRGKSCWFNLNYLSNDKRLIKANHDEERFQFSFAEELENSPYYEFVTNEEDGKETPICKVQLDLTTKSVMPQIQIHSKDRRTDDEPYKGSIYLSPIKQLIFATLPETQGYYPYKVRFNKYEEMYRYKLMDRFIEGEFTSPKGNYYKKGSFQNNFVNIFPVNTEIHEHIDVERTYRCRRV